MIVYDVYNEWDLNHSCTILINEMYYYIILYTFPQNSGWQMSFGNLWKTETKFCGFEQSLAAQHESVMTEKVELALCKIIIKGFKNNKPRRISSSYFILKDLDL